MSAKGQELTMSIEHQQQGRDSDSRQRNRRTAWIVLSIAAAFFVGVILKRILLG